MRKVGSEELERCRESILSRSQYPGKRNPAASAPDPILLKIKLSNNTEKIPVNTPQREAAMPDGLGSEVDPSLFGCKEDSVMIIS
jgi:hypothetical protein